MFGAGSREKKLRCCCVTDEFGYQLREGSITAEFNINFGEAALRGILKLALERTRKKYVV